jgi:hypothetical protein
MGRHAALHGYFAAVLSFTCTLPITATHAGILVSHDQHHGDVDAGFP